MNALRKKPRIALKRSPVRKAKRATPAVDPRNKKRFDQLLDDAILGIRKKA
jgi:hypothetical protein